MCLSFRSPPSLIHLPRSTKPHSPLAFLLMPSSPTHLHAHLPVKFRDPRTNIHCDININDRLGVKNTELVKRYIDLLPVLRPLLTAVKKWASVHGLNEPSGRKGPTSFSSYALTMMCIAFLQVGSPVPLPPCLSPFSLCSTRAEWGVDHVV